MAFFSFKYFSRRPGPSVSAGLGTEAPRVTIIRPVKGLEAELYACLASTFRQTYPRDRFSINLCVDSRHDPSYPVLEQIVRDFPDVDARVLVETDDSLLNGTVAGANIGPNPKVRNISRAYREAQGDVIWMIDCNVWVGHGVLGRMVDKLLGLKHGGKTGTAYKFVHHLPIVADLTHLDEPARGEKAVATSNTLAAMFAWAGGRLDDMFMSTTHAKFYGAINAVGIAPCIVGKSNMFRKSHLDRATDPSRNPLLPKTPKKPIGVDLFSYNICEDHLIGDILWRTAMPGFANHGTVWGDIPVQPIANMSVSGYAGRRVRWLRARKWTVLAATLVEPGVESLLCCAYFSFAITTLPWFKNVFGIPQTWESAAVAWLVTVTLWMLVDRVTSSQLHRGLAIEVDENTPRFARGTSHPDGMPPRTFLPWLLTWIGREVLAMPIWTTAVLLGRSVNWRGNEFLVRSDMTVEEIQGRKPAMKPRANGSKMMS